MACAFPACPGLSIFILDAAFSETEAAITLPHELLPVPKEGERVHGLDRRGVAVCKGTVVRVRKRAKDDPCLSVTVAVPKSFLHDVRQIARVTGERS